MASEGVLATLRQAWLALEPLELPMAVIGGLALSAWNHARFTRDADILIGMDESKVNEVLQTICQAGFYPRHSPPILQIDDQQIIQLKYKPPDGIYPFQLDLLFAGSEYQKTALTRRIKQAIPGLGHPADVLRPEDLVLLKLIAGRIIDRADAAMLLRENRPEIDLNYLTDWIRRLALHSEFAEIWREAFPSETPRAL
jgi:hypothetical protein